MKISARRGLAASTTSCALAFAASAVLVPGLTANAAGQTTQFSLQARGLSSAQAGQQVELRVSATSGDLDCSTLTLQQKVGSSWTDITHDYQESGCWERGADFVTTITRPMAENGLRLVGAVKNGDVVPLGSVTVAQGTPSQTVVTLGKDEQANVPADFGWQVGLAQVPANALGKPVALRMTAARGADIDCASIALERQDGNGSWKNVEFDYQESGCWTGGAVLQANVTEQMAGKALRLVGRAKRTSTALNPSLVGQTMVNGQADLAPVTIGDLDAQPTRPVDEKAQSEVSSPLAQIDAPAAPAPAPAPAPTAAPKPTATPTQAPVAGAANGGTGTIAQLDLPRVPWEGGSSYYNRFPDAAAGGWANPNHFPIGVWWGGYSSDQDVLNDKKLGINTYVQLNHVADYKMLTKHGMSLIGNQLDNQPRHDPGWVGDYLDDEVDGRFNAATGQGILADHVSKIPDHSKFRYANFTGMVISWYRGFPEWDANSNKYVRDYTDVLSLDSYWYSSDACDWENPNGSGWAFPFTKANCRTGQNYGRNVEGMRWRLAQAGSTQPVMNFIEVVEAAENGYTNHPLTTDEVKGAAMSSIIHEARGLIWFNQAFHGKCASGNAVRSYYNPSYPCRDTVGAMGEVNNLLQSLAPVLNSQSYQWSFGKDIDAMLKVHDGSAYIFAMGDDLHPTGKRVFTLPKPLQGHKVEVIGENRTITPNADGTFTDSFENVNKYHVYKIS